MRTSKIGFWLTLIGGLLSILGILWILFGHVCVCDSCYAQIYHNNLFLIILNSIAILFLWLTYLLIGWSQSKLFPILLLLVSILIVIGAFLMRKEKTAKLGSVLSLIFGIVVGFNILAIVGGIIGLIKSRKR